jgi:hypothetical protein
VTQAPELLVVQGGAQARQQLIFLVADVVIEQAIARSISSSRPGSPRRLRSSAL